MKTCFLKVLAILTVGTAINGYAQTDALSRAETTVPELSGLTIEECVMVLNCKTDYQVNLEMREYERRPQYRLDLIGLQKQPIEQVLTNLLSQTGDYIFVKTNKTINVIPKDRWNDTNYVFNTVLREYEVKEENLVGAWELLCHKVPALVIIQPVSVAIDSKPKWIAEEKAQPVAGAPFSLSLRNGSTRSVVNALVSKYGVNYWGDDYWVSQPSAEIPPRWQWITVFQKGYGVDVLWKHDPGLHEQFEKLMRKKAQEYEELHQTK